MSGASSAELRITDADLPAMHRSASAVSERSQHLYLRLVRWDLIALVGGALLTAVSVTDDAYRSGMATAGALALLLGLGLTLFVRSRDYSKQWYGGRAVAESVKTMAWRYMTRAEPFDQENRTEAESAQVDRLFLEQLRTAMEQSENLAIRLPAPGASAKQITELMRRLRGESLEVRRATYLRDRIEEQKCWYHRKAEHNRRREEQLFLTIIVLQVLATAAAIVLILVPSFPLNLSAVLAASAAAALGWLQVKRYQELAQAYSVTATELSLIAEQAPHVTCEAEFSQFVGDAEAAISREHTLWIARRDMPLPRPNRSR